MANWISDIIGWAINNTQNVSTVSQYVYMGAITITMLCTVIFFGEIAAILRTLVSGWRKR